MDRLKGKTIMVWTIMGNILRGCKVFTLQDNSHEAIISPRTFELAQEEFKRRKSRPATSGTIFSAKIYCGECGSIYGPKVWHSNNPKYRKVIWQCNNKFKTSNHCQTPHLREAEIRAAFLKALNHLLDIREEVIANLRGIQTDLTDTVALEAEITRLTDELNVRSDQAKDAIAQNAHIAKNQGAYQEEYAAIVSRYAAADQALKTAQAALREKHTRNAQITDFISQVTAMPDVVEEFQPEYWSVLVDRVTVKTEGEMEFVFCSGVRVEVNRSSF